MSNNPSRETGPNDRWSEEARAMDVYWLCECGLARVSAEPMESHVTNEGHFAEKIDATEGRVIGFMAGGLDHLKYANSTPSTAQIQREKNKNDPLFEDPSV